jgi:Arc/MetJ-type ribon-helix-helix transcriptional regulator
LGLFKDNSENIKNAILYLELPELKYNIFSDETNKTIKAREGSSPHADRDLIRLYGITREIHNKILAGQNNCCAICKTTEWTKCGPTVDHSHSTLRIRGILCNKCNTGLGYFKDNSEIMKSAIAYLEKWRETNEQSAHPR